MTIPTQAELNDAIHALVADGSLLPYRDSDGTVRLAPLDYAASHPELTPARLTLAEMDALLAAQEPQLMAQWN